MDHDEAARKFAHLMLRDADHAHEAVTGLEALVSLLPSEKSRQLAQFQAKASDEQAKDFRELAQKVKGSYSAAHSTRIYVGPTEENRCGAFQRYVAHTISFFGIFFLSSVGWMTALNPVRRIS